MSRLTVGLTALLATALSPDAPALAHWGDGDYYMHNMGFGGGFVGFLTMLLGLALIVVAIVWAIRWFGGEGTRSGNHGRALDILAERFAKGEISQQEYDDMRRTLSN